MKVDITKSCFLFILLLFLPFLAWSEHTDGKTKDTIYFYNPETNINNFVSLKISFDTYLSKFGNYRFQPFDKKELFEAALFEGNHGIYLLSSWHYQSLRDEIDLQPLLVGVFNGQSTHKKILTVKRNITDVMLLKGKTIASSGNEQYTINLLKEIIGNANQEILQTVKLILVPKDIDALMAVGFGMAAAAITSERSFENLRKINPKQHQRLRPLMESQQHYLALAALPAKANMDAAALLDILEKMGINAEGEIRLRMLGLDGWRRLSKQEQLLLKQKEHKGL